MRTRRSAIVATVIAAVLLTGAACAGDPSPNAASYAAPAPDTRGWTKLPAAPVQEPVTRVGQATVWTGQQVLVWGGAPVGPDGCAFTPHPDGAAWNPTSRTWTVMAPAPVTARQDADLWWTGTSALLIGGRDPLAACHGQPDGLLDGAVFTPGPTTVSAPTDFATAAQGSWSRLPPLPWPAGTAVTTSAWTGQQLLVWSPLQGGWSLTPGQDAWTALPAAPVPVPAAASPQPTAPGEGYAWAHSLWTGEQWLVWSRQQSQAGTLDQGLAYDPAAGSWRSIKVGPVLRSAGVVWSGTQALTFPPTAGVFTYDVDRDAWTRGADGPVPLLGSTAGSDVGWGPVLAWTGSRLLVWGGQRERDLGRCTDGNGVDDSALEYGGSCNPATGPLGGLYDPRTDTWQEITDGPWQRRVETAAVAMDGAVLLVGGRDLERERDGVSRPYPDTPQEAAVTVTPSDARR